MICIMAHSLAKYSQFMLRCIYNVETEGLEMLTKVQKWGNSLALRIPKALAEEVGLESGSTVELIAENGHLHVISVKRLRYTLEELVAQITPENRHGEIDIGPAVGNEVW